MKLRSFASMCLPTLVLSTLPLAAQNLFEIYPTRPNISTTDYTRLCVPDASGGEILIEVAPTHFCNVGGAPNCSCSAIGIDVTVADGDDSTPDQFRGVWRNAALGAPIYTNWQPMTTGTGGPSVETFRIPFVDAFGQPAPIALPCTATFYFGIEVGPRVCDDGVFVAASRYQSALSGCAGETARFGAPSLLFCGPAPIGPYVPWIGPKNFSLRMGLTMDAPVLNIGNQAGIFTTPCAPWDTGYGVGGLYPFNSSSVPPDTLWARVQDTVSPNGTAILIASLTPFPAVCVPPYGMLCLLPDPGIFLRSFALDDDGVGYCKVMTLNPFLSGATMTFQALSLGSGLLTNAEITRP